MSQGVSVESSTQPIPSPSINPALHAALSSLDVQLEEELYRYRRQRSGRPMPPSRGLGRHKTRKSIELISVGSAGSPTQSPVSRISVPPPKTYTQPTLINPTFPAYAGAAATQELTDETGWQDGPSSTYTEQSLSSQITLLKNAAPSSDNPASVNPDPQSGNPEAAGAAPHVDLADPYANNLQPDDYLASSEQLLRSLAEEEADVRAERRFLDSVLTPLGVGLMLLLLLSSATVGYIVMNPSIWAGLKLDRFAKPQTPTVAQNPTQGIPVNGNVNGNQPGPQTANGSNQVSPLVTGPNLATQEFVELNLNTLSSLKTNISPTPVVPKQQALPPGATAAKTQKQVSSAAVAGRPSDLASALLPPSVSSAAMSPRIPAVAPLPAPPAIVSTPATPAAKPKQTAAATKIPSASRPAASSLASAPKPGKDYYYVLSNYQNDRSLAQTRKVAADAYVRNFPTGPRIQVATFTNESQAKKMVQELQKQGIYAWVYHQP